MREGGVLLKRPSRWGIAGQRWGFQLLPGVLIGFYFQCDERAGLCGVDFCVKARITGSDLIRVLVHGMDVLCFRRERLDLFSASRRCFVGAQEAII